MDEAEAKQFVMDPNSPLEQRIEAAEALGNPQASDAAFDVLAPIVAKDFQPLELRIAACRSLARMGRRRRGVEVFIHRSDYPLPLRREAIDALRTLGRIHPEQEDSFQLELAAGYTNLYLWGRDTRVVNQALAMLRDPDPERRRSGVATLALVGELHSMLVALADEDPAVRAFAAHILGTHGIGDQAEIDALRQALSDGEPSVQQMAKRSLRALGGLDRVKPPEHSVVAVPFVDPRFDWPDLLERYSHAYLRDQWYSLDLPDEVVASGWLGFPGADEAHIAAVEERLGLKFPPSYRSFLKTSNGFRHAGVPDVWPVDQVRRSEAIWPDADWSQEDDAPAELYFVYGPEQDPVNVRYSYLPGCLVITGEYQGDMYLLNPEVHFGDEWEAWVLSPRAPGAYRYQSFWDLMLEEYKSQASKLA
jgi:hypothetical protein